MNDLGEVVRPFLIMWGAQLVILSVATWGLVLWGVSVARTRATRPWWLAAGMPFLALVAHLAATTRTVDALLPAVESLANGLGADRLPALADSLASAKWSTAMGFGLSLILYVGSIGTFARGSRPTREVRRSRSPPSLP